LKTLSRAIESLWNSFLLPFFGLLVSMNLITAFTHWSSMDALLAILVFSVWYGIRRIEARLEAMERHLSRVTLRCVQESRRDVIADGEANGTLLSSDETPTSVGAHASWPRAR
jgi:hypothetical protein